MTSEEYATQRETRLKGLLAAIQEAIYDSENLRDFNTLAMILMTKSLDILGANYEENEVFSVAVHMIEDRRQKRQVPVTEAYVEKLSAMQKFLP